MNVDDLVYRKCPLFGLIFDILNLTWNRTEKEKMIQLKFDVHFMVVMLMFMNKLNGVE